MGKKRAGGSKTDAIREHLSAHPNDGSSAVAAALNQRGIDVTPQYVSTIKSKLGLGSKRRRGRPAGKTSAASAGSAAGSGGGARKAQDSSGAVGYDNLVEAKKFVQSLGGMAKARKVLDAYANLQ